MGCSLLLLVGKILIARRGRGMRLLDLRTSLLLRVEESVKETGMFKGVEGADRGLVECASVVQTKQSEQYKYAW